VEKLANLFSDFVRKIVYDMRPTGQQGVFRSWESIASSFKIRNEDITLATQHQGRASYLFQESRKILIEDSQISFVISFARAQVVDRLAMAQHWRWIRI